MGIEINAN